MANIVEKLLGFFTGSRAARPFAEQGVMGTGVFAGQPQNIETNPKLSGGERWRTASDLLANISIIAAGVRLFLNLTSRPKWIVEPADEKRDSAKQAAEFVEEVLESTNTSWSRIVRRSGLYRFHGFGIQEWVALRREDGRIGLACIEPRPAHTIEAWDLAPSGDLLGVIQRSPLDSRQLYLPRSKIIYLVDDMLSDSPEGLGWYRHLAEPAERLKAYMRLEGIGFQRDLSGIPIGRAPLAAIEKAVKNGQLTREEADTLINGIRRFVEIQNKAPNTGLVLDSQPWEGSTADGKTVSTILQWGIELLTGEQTSLDKLADAIRRLNFDMALIMGTEVMLTGREGAGSLALSEDKSRNLYLNVNSTLVDMAECFRDDMLDPIMAMNNIAEEDRPRLKTEDASFKDAEKASRVLRDMAAAGGVIAPDDPAIDDLRDLLGISRQPEMTPERAGMLMPRPEPEPEPSTGKPPQKGQPK